MASLVSNTEEYRRQIALANSEEAKGSMDREFQTRMTTLSAKWQIFKNQLFNTNSEVGKAMKQSLIEMMETIARILDNVNAWVKANPKLTAQLGKWAIYGTATMGVFGLLASTLSFLIYPIARLGLALSKYIGISKLFSAQNGKNIVSLSKWKTKGLQILGVLSKLGASFASAGRFILSLLNPLNLVKNVFLALKIVALAVFSPIGAILAVLSVAGIAICKNWETVSAFFNGFFQGFQTAAKPILTLFEPLKPLFNAISEAIKTALNWIMSLFTPTEKSAEALESAAEWGRKLGEWTATALNLALTPLNLLIDGVKWLTDNIKNISFDSIGNGISNAYNDVKGKLGTAWNKTTALFTGEKSETTQKLEQAQMGQKWSGGYAGNGGKYEPKGIYHGGEYIMTKEATQRIGVANLNRLNYGGVAGMLALSSSIAFAQPMPAVQVDNRPLISSTQLQRQAPTPVHQTVSININATSSQSAEEIAKIVARELEKAQRQAQAKARSSLRDRD